MLEAVTILAIIAVSFLAGAFFAIIISHATVRKEVQQLRRMHGYKEQEGS